MSIVRVFLQQVTKEIVDSTHEPCQASLADTHFILMDNGTDGFERSAMEMRERVEFQLAQSNCSNDSVNFESILSSYFEMFGLTYEYVGSTSR